MKSYPLSFPLSRPNSFALSNAVLGGASAPFIANPYALFTQGQAGGWFNFSSSSLLFTGSTGVTPPTDGQTVALAIGSYLADPLGAGLGAELLTNADFGSATGWGPQAGWSIGSGLLTASGAAAFSITAQSISFTAGNLYQSGGVVTAVSAGNVRVGTLNGGTAVNATLRSSPGAYADYLVSQTGNIQFIVQAGSGGYTGTVDSATLKLIPGYAARQGSSSFRPTWKSALGGYIDFDGLDDVLTATFPTTFTGDVVWLKSDGSIGQLLGQSITTSYNLPTDDMKHCVIRSTMTSTELASLIAWMRRQPLS